MTVKTIEPSPKSIDGKLVAFIREKASLRSSEISELEKRNREMLHRLDLIESEYAVRDAQIELYKAGATALNRLVNLETIIPNISLQLANTSFQIEKLNELLVSKTAEIDSLKNRLDALVKETGTIAKDLELFKTAEDIESAKFEALKEADKVSYVKKNGVPLHRSIRTRKLPVIYLQKELPVRVPINETLHQHTAGQMGRITCWFNPAVITWKGRHLMTYRCECYPHWRHGRTGICETADNWEPIPNTARWTMFPGRQGYAESEDGRWVVHKGRLLMAYNTGYRQRMAWLKEDLTMERWGEFHTDDFLFSDREKNWSFFSHEDQLFAIYTQAPYSVISVDEQSCKVSKAFEEPWKFPWNFGVPRGGTSPVIHNGFYWHFFHSSGSIDGTKEDCGWGIMRRYYVGVVLFETKPPFKLVSASRYPIFSGVPDPDRTKLGITMPSDHAVVFPASAHRNPTNTGWVLATGVNDQHCYIYEVPDSLITSRMA